MVRSVNNSEMASHAGHVLAPTGAHMATRQQILAMYHLYIMGHSLSEKKHLLEPFMKQATQT